MGGIPAVTSLRLVRGVSDSGRVNIVDRGWLARRVVKVVWIGLEGVRAGFGMIRLGGVV